VIRIEVASVIIEHTAQVSLWLSFALSLGFRVQVGVEVVVGCGFEPRLGLVLGFGFGFGIGLDEMFLGTREHYEHYEDHVQKSYTSAYPPFFLPHPTSRSRPPPPPPLEIHLIKFPVADSLLPSLTHTHGGHARKEQWANVRRL
jgi:hypothetical protein